MNCPKKNYKAELPKTQYEYVYANSENVSYLCKILLEVK